MLFQPKVLLVSATILLAAVSSSATGQDQNQVSPPAPSGQPDAPIVCPVGMPGMGPGRMQGGGEAPMQQNMADWQQMHQTMRQMHAEMQAMRGEMAQLRRQMRHGR
jgi:hypothetical protein